MEYTMSQPLKRPFHNNLEKCPVVKKYNDLLLTEHRFVLHNIAVIQHTIKALWRQFLTDKASFSCEFAQLTDLSLSKSQIFM
jgi:hypothetical protein